MNLKWENSKAFRLSGKMREIGKMVAHWLNVKGTVKDYSSKIYCECKGVDCPLRSWWWNKIVQKIIKSKQVAYKNWQKHNSNENLEKEKSG